MVDVDVLLSISYPKRGDSVLAGDGIRFIARSKSHTAEEDSGMEEGKRIKAKKEIRACDIYTHW